MSPTLAPMTFAFLLLDGFPHISLSCALEPLRLANFISGRDVYKWTLASLTGQAVRASNGLLTPVHQGLTPLDRRSKLMIVSGDEALYCKDQSLLAYLRNQRAHGVSLGGLCSGAYLLAQAGFLSGREAAIHWAYHDVFSERFPDVRLTKSLFVADSAFPTCSGGTATIDLLLDMIFQDHGRDLAVAVAEQLVYTGMRDGKSPQRFSVQFRHGMRNDLLSRAINMMTETIEAPLSSAEIAQDLRISVRQLERLFAKHLGMPPMRYSLELRLTRARNLLLQSETSISEIALASGFSSMSHFSKVFRGRFGYAPAHERNARLAAAL